MPQINARIMVILTAIAAVLAIAGMLTGKFP